jgi:hypothetical protein
MISSATTTSALAWQFAPSFGRGQVERGREQPGVFPQGFLGVNAFRSELRTEWFPAPAVKTLAETGAPAWAVRNRYVCESALTPATSSWPDSSFSEKSY